MHRFYITPEKWNADALVLAGAEARHAARVLRLKPGARVAAFNGRGREVTAEIVSIHGDEIRLRKLHEALTPPLRCRIALAQAIPKGKNMDLIVQKAVEIGAAEIAPLLSDRTVVTVSEEGMVQKQQKWQQIAIEAAKQCGQNWLPSVHRPKTVRDFFSAAPDFDLQLIGSLQSDAMHLKTVLADYRREHGDRPASVMMCIGPEGDFTPAELNLARARGCIPITLGPIILRVETAAIYCLSILSYELLT
ncbi:MAG: rRNA (uracil1498-N3)-methyltransferase [Verrucomicrobiota bacterium]